MDNSLFPRIQEIFTRINSGVIFLPSNPSVDAVASATSLYLALVKMGKSMSIVCSTPVKLDLIAEDKISSQIGAGGENLVISFPYTEGSIDKVDYNIQGSFFNLVVVPRQGYTKINPNQVKYTYTGAQVDAVIVIDAPNLNSLGSAYTDNQNQFQGKDIINIDRHLTNANYGTVNYINKTASSISEMIIKLMQNIQLQLDKDIATNLYSGIAASTNNFTSYSVNAETFENIALLLRSGAIKKSLKKPMINPFPSSYSQPPSGNFNQKNTFQPSGVEIHKVKPISTVEKEVKPEDPTTNSQDWLKPKIFSNSSGGLT